MKIIISTEGDQIRPLDFNGESIKKVNKIFDRLELDLPAVPYPGQKVGLAKDGMKLSGTVDYVVLNWYAKGNGLFIKDTENRVEYFVRLKDMEIEDCLDDSFWEE